MLSRVVLLGAFLVGSATLANATPLDSPDTVYIDGTPCNRACQAYMAWSRQILSGRAPQSPAGVADSRSATTVPAKPKPATHDSASLTATAAGRPSRDKVARQPEMGGIPVPVSKPADMASRTVANPAESPPAVTSAVSPTPDNPSTDNNKPANDIAAAQPSVDTAAAGQADKPVERTAGLQQPTLAAPPDSVDHAAAPPEPPANAPSDAGPKSGSNSGSESSTTTNSKPGVNTKRVQDQMNAAAALAEQLTSTAAARPELHAMTGTSENAGRSVPTNAAASPEAPVVLVISRPEIGSVADLTGKNIAIDGKRSGSANDVRVALVAAGAGEVRVSSADTTAIERLMNGEVAAAVLTMVSPDAAETFPDIAGYKVFRVPLSPPSSKAPPDKP